MIGLRAELRAAEADVFDDAVHVLERDPFAQPHRPLGQHDQPADEIVDERLAAETDADRQATAEDRKGGKRHVDRVERGERHEHQQAVKHQRADRRRGVFAEPKPLQEAIGEHAGRGARQHPADDQDRQALDGYLRRDRLLADVDGSSLFQTVSTWYHTPSAIALGVSASTVVPISSSSFS